MSIQIFTGYCIVDSEGDIKYIAIDFNVNELSPRSMCEIVRNREYPDCKVATYREVASSLEGVPNVYDFHVIEENA